MRRILLWSMPLTLTVFTLACSHHPCGHGSGKVLDEAQCVGRGEESLKSADEDFFADMDYGVSRNPEVLRQRLTPFIPSITAEQATQAFVRGRNNWIVWTGGNDAFWDELTHISLGYADLLKTISNHPSLKANRNNRWQYLGVLNEPCYTIGDQPHPERFGLYLDVRDPSCEKDPFEDEAKYPGVKIGSRGDTIPIGSYYGYGTGIIGLRLFPNPDFDEKAKAHWDAERYYTDPEYYLDKDLVKPYRVGMSCGFCHVGPNPANPPRDPENPTWANLNSNPGAQYLWIDRVLMYNPDPSNFPLQLFHTSRPGALDTSLISSDYINNPRTMNAVYNLAARMEIAQKFGQENLGGDNSGSRNNKQFNDLSQVPENSALNRFYEQPDTVFAPRVLKDGADSVGALGALNRVYINIGLFSEEWLEHFRPLLGGKKISPIEIEVARKNSSYWRANEEQTSDVALFFLASATPDYLKSAPGGDNYLSQDQEQVDLGKAAFADTCARCHSSKLPEKAYSFFPDKGCVDSKGDRNYLQCWSQYWEYTQSPEFKQAMRSIVVRDDFLENNFLSNDLRIPVTLLETNACSPLASNGIRDNIWDNFTSESYKSLPAVGSMAVQHPYTGEVRDFELTGGGRGYTRPGSLVSLWSSAPFLLNNTLGDFYWTGSVDDRIKSYNNAVEQLLWPEKRSGDFVVMTASGKTHPGIIDRTTATSFLSIPSGFLPGFLKPLEGFLARIFPWAFGGDGVKIGPIPEGTPVNLLSNIDMEEKKKVLSLLLKIKTDLKTLGNEASDEEARKVFADLVEPLLEVNECPDFVVNKGHYFGTSFFKGEEALSDAEKEALIEFMKTF